MDQKTVQPASVVHEMIARAWVDSFQQYEAGMLSMIEMYLTDDFELICPGDPNIVPFAGIWKGTDGHQKWLDLFFGFFKRSKTKDVTYSVSDHSVTARWLEKVTLQGIACEPVQIHMYFHFLNGRLARIFDDYDSQTGASSIVDTQSLLDNPA